MDEKKGFTPLEIGIPNREKGRFPERHGEGSHFAGSQTDIRQQHRSFLTGFTLIELLVVIAIIALLMGILMPALTAVREQGRRAVCGQNEKNMGLGLHLYANDNDGKLPLNEVDRWLFDVSYWTTDIILRTGAFDRHIFYCPSWRQRDNIIFWRYGENFPAGTPENHPQPEPQSESTRKNYHRIMGYFWFIDTVRGRENPPMSPDNKHKEWVRSVIATKRSAATVELIADVTASNGPDRAQSDFTKATGGCWSRWQVYDRTNHLRRGARPAGGNILFVDGHVQWRHFNEMEHRWFWQSNANPCFWW
jgi:prepilin-type N-terminal cleavage/methylation domain-containing protein/prepilin-type processing-associated H-X9-DG protein